MDVCSGEEAYPFELTLKCSRSALFNLPAACCQQMGEQAAQLNVTHGGLQVVAAHTGVCKEDTQHDMVMPHSTHHMTRMCNAEGHTPATDQWTGSKRTSAGERKRNLRRHNAKRALLFSVLGT
eukprot:scaffold269659_cov19-Tisochrysis_lutea.AAC.1